MGCGVSRFNREDGVRPASGPIYLYINPLHRRIEDFAFRRRGDKATAATDSPLSNGGSPSSKQLLYVDPDDVDSSLSSDHKLDGGNRKSVSSPRLLKNDAAAAALLPTHMSEPAAQVMKAKECSEDVQVMKTKECSEDVEEVIRVVREVREGGEEVEEVVKEVVAEKERGSGGDRKEEEEEEEEEEGGGDREDSMLLYPGSPSFREYCVSSFDESGDGEDSPKNVDGAVFLLLFFLIAW